MCDVLRYARLIVNDLIDLERNLTMWCAYSSKCRGAIQVAMQLRVIPYRNIEQLEYPKGTIGGLRLCPYAVLSSNAVEQTIHASGLPELRTDLVAALAALDVHELTHLRRLP